MTGETPKTRTSDETGTAFSDSNDPELVDIVDENDVVVRTASRAEMRRKVLRHRAVFIAVVDDAGKVLVHRRSPDKDIWPGWLDVAVGGVLKSGETYEMAAEREVAEEIGVRSPVLEPFDDGRPQPYDDDDVSLLGRCFLLRHAGPFHFADGEITEAWWVPVTEIEPHIRTENFLPDSTALLLDRLLTRFG